MARKFRLPRRAILTLSALSVYLAARRVADAPPDPDLEARADAAAHSGPWTHNFVVVNDIRLHYAEMGSGPAVVLLHGYPQNWYMWHRIMARLGAHFHVIALDMRGFNWSDKPSGVAEYSTEVVADEVASLISTLGVEKAHVIGHDWGGIVAWQLAMRHPERVNRLAVINAPHPAVFARDSRKPSQWLRSTYVLFFQVPVISEAVARLAVRRMLSGSAAVPGAFSEEALDIYENGISQPGAATAMLNYYRAAFRRARTLLLEKWPPIHAQTMLIWGLKDVALTPGLSEGTEEWVPNLRVERIEDSGHWVPEEKPRRVGDLLLEFLSEREDA